SVGLFTLGAVPVAAVNGWSLAWQHGPWVTGLCVAILVWYLLTVGVTAYSRTLALRAIREKLKQRELELQAANQALFVRLSDIEHLQGILKEQANIDPLTGLYNRRYLQSTLDREWARSLREQQPLCVVLIDIDYFKRVNDTHGHGVGDQVLVALGRLLAKGVRTEDLACRYGGEEFLVLMPKMPLDMALERAEQWRQGFAEQDIRVAGARLALTMSLGVAVAPEHAASPEELVRHADEALYRAKAQGRNQVVVFSRPDAPGE
ncbi:GGDEF domain-containing protein, partial [Aquabacterium sp. A08]|uniref:GGDEF domain-containing protein n=1 Tax=Aquabacterium sp. A08 TaxID=2718532 RepID=UPI00141EF203